jgi:hypothetical protein
MNIEVKPLNGILRASNKNREFPIIAAAAKGLFFRQRDNCQWNQ